MSAGDPTFGLFGEQDPFAPTPPPPAALAAPPNAAASVPSSDPNAPPPATEYVTAAQYRALEEQLRPLAWVGQALADPQIAARVRSAIFNAGAGVGAPPSASPTPVPAVDPAAAIRERVQQKLQEGDIAGAIVEASTLASASSEARARAQLETAAQPVLMMTAQNAIEGWFTSKRAASPAFARIEPKVREFVASTPPAKLAELAQNGQLYPALDMAYAQVFTQIQEAAYNKAVSEGRLQQPGAAIPPYTAPGGGPLGARDLPTDDDKDDEEFNKLMKEKGVNFTIGPNGAIVGELK